MPIRYYNLCDVSGVFLQVLYYLVRVEPFTTLSIQLQGGKFDHADRMFSDVTATWNGGLEDMSDVKELVCFFFYLWHENIKLLLSKEWSRILSLILWLLLVSSC